MRTLLCGGRIHIRIAQRADMASPFQINGNVTIIAPNHTTHRWFGQRESGYTEKNKADFKRKLRRFPPILPRIAKIQHRWADEMKENAEKLKNFRKSVKNRLRDSAQLPR
ncbi:MAG: hypothetical protein WD046_02355 [Paracoccaceae bacterium]